MMPSRTKYLALVASIWLISCGSHQGESRKEHWTVAAASCPVGCSTGMQSNLKTLIGSQVTWSEARFSAPFVDECEGRTESVLESRSATSVIEELNRALPDGLPRFSLAMLDVKSSDVMSAVVYCVGSDMRWPILRMPVVEDGRALALLEENALIELR